VKNVINETLFIEWTITFHLTTPSHANSREPSTKNSNNL